MNDWLRLSDDPPDEVEPADLDRPVEGDVTEGLGKAASKEAMETLDDADE